MNWTWSLRARDGGMNGLELSRCTTAGGITRVLVHAAPAQLAMEVRADSDELIASGDLDRDGDYSPMTLVELAGGRLSRREVWPDESFHGTAVILPGGEVGLLRGWYHAPDHSWWRWSVELSNHIGRPADWSPPE